MTTITYTAENEGAQWLLQSVDKDGNKTSDVLHSDKALDNETLFKEVDKFTRTVGTRRAMMHTILAQCMANPRMDSFKPFQNAETGVWEFPALQPDGKVTPEFNGQLRKAEGEFFESLVQMKPLPAGKAWNIVAEEKQREVCNDNNYKVARSKLGKYFAVTGQLPVTKTGYLVPIKVIDQAIKDSMPNITPPTLGEKIAALLAGIKDGLDYNEAVNALAEAKTLVDSLQDAVNRANEMSTMAQSGLPGGLADNVKQIVDHAKTATPVAEAIEV